MADIHDTSAASNKKFDNLTVTDNFSNTYLFVRTGKDRRGIDRWFNIAKCEIHTPDGLVHNAVPFHPEEVAYIVAEAEESDRDLERVESLLEQWIDLRRFRSRNARSKRGKLSPEQQSKEGGGVKLVAWSA